MHMEQQYQSAEHIPGLLHTNAMKGIASAAHMRTPGNTLSACTWEQPADPAALSQWLSSAACEVKMLQLLCDSSSGRDSGEQQQHLLQAVVSMPDDCACVRSCTGAPERSVCCTCSIY